MTYPELQIQFDLNPDNLANILENVDTCRWIGYGYLFVDNEDGQCYLFDIDGNLDDIGKVKYIGNNAFAHCKSLTSIKIPDSVKSIGSWAFRDCISLKSIKIPDSVKCIRYGAFENCTSLKNIKIPVSVRSIGSWAFFDCKSLKEVVFEGKTMKQIKAMEWYPWGIINKISIIKVKN